MYKIVFGIEKIDREDLVLLTEEVGRTRGHEKKIRMRQLVEQLQAWDFQVCAIFVLDAGYMVDAARFLSGSLTALATMVQLEVPHINILTKMDLLNRAARQQLEMFLEPEIHELLASEHNVSRFNKKYHKLTHALGKVLDDFSLVRYIPLNINDEESLTDVLIQTDFALQYGEDLDVKGKDFEYPDPEDRDLKKNIDTYTYNLCVLRPGTTSVYYVRVPQ
ncbi:GPN-loop GTPase 3 [Portunus trituberculatus]|uniref:GPN-loop GTPase 3 n=1 Tax=Portunus trituberculatus TaxID=210409 RepID=A0A5B7CHY6_PORTR|nr:GPN-loop GTPase 3 [Portunus trituberculatus]